MRILVSGATGYVGSAVTLALLERGHQVTAIARPGTRVEAADDFAIEWVEADLGDPARVVDLARAHDGVAHLAAHPSPAFETLNTSLLSRLLPSMRDDQAFLMQAGSLVFGDSAAGAIDDATAFDAPPMLATRVGLERSVLAHAAVEGRPRAFICYAAFVYGGTGGAIPNVLFDAARRFGESGYVGDGRQAWSPVHVDDWASLMVHCLERGPAGGRRVFAADRAPLSMAEIAGLVGGQLGVGVRGIPAPDAAARFGPFSGALAISQVLTRTGLAAALGWRSRQCGFAEWLATFGAWR